MLDVSFDIPSDVIAGLNSGKLKRVGGVIVESDSNNIYCWLRESELANSTETIEPTSLNVSKILGFANLAVSTLGLGATLYFGKKNIDLSKDILNEVKNTQEIVRTEIRRLEEIYLTIEKTKNKTDLSLSLIELKDAILSGDTKRQVRKIILDVIKYIPGEMLRLSLIKTETYSDLDMLLGDVISLIKIMSLSQSLSFNYCDDPDICMAMIDVIGYDKIIDLVRKAISSMGLLDEKLLASLYLSPESCKSLDRSEREFIFSLLSNVERNCEFDKVSFSESDNFIVNVIHDDNLGMIICSPESSNALRSYGSSIKDVLYDYLSMMNSSPSSDIRSYFDRVSSDDKMMNFFFERRGFLYSAIYNKNIMRDPYSNEVKKMEKNDIDKNMSIFRKWMLIDEYIARLSGVEIEVAFCQKRKINLNSYKEYFYSELESTSPIAFFTLPEEMKI